jgi:hypothetical protein
MSGVRLHHPQLRGVTYTITNYAVRLVSPMFCWACSGGPEADTTTPRAVIHEFKTYHLQIDAAGDVVVAEELVEMMHRTGLLREAGLVAMATIPHPDRQVVEIEKFEVPMTYDQEVGLIR